MSKAVVGRLILEASTGMHGEEAKILSDAWADMAQQRAELLEALKSLHKNVLGNSGMWGSYFASPVFGEVTNAIAKAEAAE